MATTPRTTAPLIIEDTYVRQDEQGRYSLNDLHAAAGGEERHRPSRWTENQQTKDLIAEIEAQAQAGIPACVSVQRGASPGTYVARELVYAYAMWISPAFNLKVIRTFDALMTGNRAGIGGVNQPVGIATGMATNQLIALQDHAWKLVTRLKKETQPQLRATLYEQLQDVYRDLGKEAPPLAAIGGEAPKEGTLAVQFWGVYRLLQEAGVVLNHSRDPKLIAINLNQVAQAAQTHRLRLPASAPLKVALRTSRSPRFKDVRSVASAIHTRSDVGHTVPKTMHCWVFEIVQEGGAA
jgi:hypothetical protein